MQRPVDTIKTGVRGAIRRLAIVLDGLSRGKISPNGVTWFGFLAHFLIGYLIATNHLLWAGSLLVFFGLFDTLDGELARYQKRVTNNGGFLDASTDRFKEVILYSAAAYVIAGGHHPQYAVFAAVACGASLSVSYVKAKGEATVASLDKKIPYTVLNKMFAGGLFPFEIRMIVLILGLISYQLVWAVVIIAVLSSVAAMQRLIIISRSLR